MLLFSQTQNLRSDPANSKTLCQKNHSNFFSKFFLTFSLASKHLRFYYIAQYSRYRSAYFGSQCTNFQMAFFDEFCIFGVLTCNIYNKILILEQSDQFYSLLILALFLPILGQRVPKVKKWKISDHSQNKILL